MDRITEKDLDQLCIILNNRTGAPIEPHWHDADGKYRSNIGNYHISHAYGGVSLHRMANEHGGVEDVFRCGHTPKRELYTRICAYLDGLEAARYRDVTIDAA